MQNKFLISILGLAVLANVLLNLRLGLQVARLEKQLAPVINKQAAEDRQKANRQKFTQRMELDQKKYSRDQLGEAERLYQIANQKWGTPEALQSLKTMIEKYPDIDRTGCAVLYVAQMSAGDDRAKYLQDCMDKYADCFYGDGVQVGAFACYLMAQDFKASGNTEKARALFAELKLKYPDAIDHGGNSLVESIGAATD
ncbi:MAG TPA: hypothetical protein VFV23_13915 [Verrucomicrobiae bacterium]|nr:hypothetical protein [Verrucomicrobiae bacterium]